MPCYFTRYLSPQFTHKSHQALWTGACPDQVSANAASRPRSQHAKMLCNRPVVQFVMYGRTAKLRQFCPSRASSFQRHLESVLNALAQLVYRLHHYNHITDALATLHWMRQPERVNLKVAVMAFHVLHGHAPTYLSQLVRVADSPGSRQL